MDNYITYIQKISSSKQNNMYIMRDDLIPFSFGGNKARKAYNFFKDIEKTKSDYVITYGSATSNHCRIIANMCQKRSIKCTIISTEKEDDSFNRRMCKLFGAEIIECKINEVKETINNQLKEKKEAGYNPYFIQGGGHGNIGTKAYVDAYSDIVLYEKTNNIKFDYIFHASGTGTTQAGLVIGSKINNSNVTIVGISIARRFPYGRDVIVDSIKDYMKENNLYFKDIEKSVIFRDEYISGGYGESCKKINETIESILKNEGIPLDATYTGKAFYGMNEYIKNNKIKNKNILFIHTGGTPIFFDYLVKK